MSHDETLATALEGIELADRKMNDYLVYVLLAIFCGFGCTIVALCWWFPAVFGTCAFAGVAWAAETERQKWDRTAAEWEIFADKLSKQMEISE